MSLKIPFSGLALLLMAVSCAGVLGIEDAQLEATSTGGASGSGAGGADAGGGGVSARCAAYCAAVMSNCAKDSPDAQYVSAQQCLEVCKTLPPGRLGDDKGDTVECRLHYAELAGQLGEKDINCPAAGPIGGPSTGVPTDDIKCGTKCEAFCSIAMHACTGDDSIYASAGDCLAQCQTLPDVASYTAKITTGNSVECRTYHAASATLDPTTHCPHSNIAIKAKPCAD